MSEVKERSMKFWDARPCNSGHAQTPESLDSQLWAQEFTDRKHLVEPHIWRWTRFPQWRGKRVLILGCGIGTMAIEFARYRARVEAWDMSGESLDIACRRANYLGLIPWIDFVKGDIEEIEPTGMFDLVYSFGVLHHTPNPHLALSRAREHLKSDGKLMIMVYNKWAWKWLKMYILHGRENGWSMARTIRARSEAQTGCPWTTVWDRLDVDNLLYSSGYVMEDMEVDHIFPYQVEPYKRFEYKLAFPWSVTPPVVFRWLERHYGLHLLVTARKSLR